MNLTKLQAQQCLDEIVNWTLKKVIIQEHIILLTIGLVSLSPLKSVLNLTKIPAAMFPHLVGEPETRGVEALTTEE